MYRVWWKPCDTLFNTLCLKVSCYVSSVGREYHSYEVGVTGSSPVRSTILVDDKQVVIILLQSHNIEPTCELCYHARDTYGQPLQSCSLQFLVSIARKEVAPLYEFLFFHTCHISLRTMRHMLHNLHTCFSLLLVCSLL